MRAPGARRAGQQAVPAPGSQHRIFGQAVLALRGDAPPNDGIAAAADGRFHPARPQRHFALRDGKVTFLGAGCQQRRRIGILCTQHQTAGIFIQPVHRAEHAGRALPLQVEDPAVGQRFVRMVERWVHSQPGRLVQHSGKIVLIDDL